MRGGKREGAGRKKLNHRRITFYLDNDLKDFIDSIETKSISKKINTIIRMLKNLTIT